MILFHGLLFGLYTVVELFTCLMIFFCEGDFADVNFCLNFFGHYKVSSYLMTVHLL